MRRIFVVLILLVVLVGSVFADFRFAGGAKMVWGYNFLSQDFSVSGRDKTSESSGKTATAANLVMKVTGDYFYFNFGGAIYSRSNQYEGINARITLKGIPLFKEAGIDIENLDQLDFLVGNQIIRSNKVYADPLAHDDGSVQLLIATNSVYLPAGVEFGTKDWTVKIGGTVVNGHQEIGGNLRLRLFDGAVWAEAGYAYNSDTEFINKNRLGHKFDDGGNGHRVGASAAIDVAQLLGKEDLNVVLSGDVQLNLTDDTYLNRNANAYYGSVSVTKDSFFFGAEYRDIPKTVEEIRDSSNVLITPRTYVRLKAVEGIVSYKFTEEKLAPELSATAGCMLSRESIPGAEVALKDDKPSFMCSVSGSITVLGLTMKLGFTYNEHEPDKYDESTCRAYFELNFKF